MELRHFRYFVAVAEELHFGKAAAHLHIAQPALSIQIKKIETQLGGQLFHRTSRSVALTEAGELFLKEAKQALYHAQQAEHIAKEALKGNIGKINIGYSGSVTYSGLLGRYIQSFRHEKPDIELQLKEMNPFTQLEYLNRGDIDVGFLPTFALKIPKNITTLALTYWPPCIAMPAEHPLSHRDCIHISELEEDFFITYSNSPQDDGAAAIRTLMNYEPKIICKESNIMSVLALVGSGMGIAIVPDVLHKTLNQPGLIFKPLIPAGHYIDISLAFIDHNASSSLCAFIEHIRQHYVTSKPPRCTNPPYPEKN